jgi:hypothetical protein
MSGGGVFNLLTNDGKADKLIMATDFLNRRMQHVICARRSAGESNPMPTLQDIEKTHLLFVNAHFKPFCALAFEYQKVRPQGTPALGSTLTFAIPQFGDFFSDMVLRVTMGSVASSVQTTPAHAAGTNYPVASTTGTAAVDWNGSVFSPALAAGAAVNYSLVDAFGNAIDDSSARQSYRNLVRYVEYPGERLCSEVKFEVNGNQLDVYDDLATCMVRKFTLHADKEVGYKRLCGQEVAIEGVSGVQRGQVFDNNRESGTVLTDMTGNSPSVQQNQTGTLAKTPGAFLLAGFPDSTWGLGASGIDGSLTHSATSGYQHVFRKELKALDGLQTPKYVQPATDLWCKLRFWFNERIDQAMPSVAVPQGRVVSIALNTLDKLVVEAPGLYVKRVIDSATEAESDSASTLVTTIALANNVRTIEYRPYVSAGTLTMGVLTNVELYVNNLFVNPEIHDIYINRIGFSLIRVFRMHKQVVNTENTDEKLLNQLKWPIEYMFVGLRPTWNYDATNSTMYRDWHRMCKVVDIESREHDKAEVVSNTTVINEDATSDNITSVVTTRSTTGGAGHTSRIYSVQQDRYTKSLKTFGTLTLTAHGVKIFDTFSEKFFSTYMPYAFGGPNIISPQDEGCLMFNFALYPGTYQPSGHMNISRAREFYLSWTSAYTNGTTTSELIVVAKALNFLLVANGSAVLRFTT